MSIVKHLIHMLVEKEFLGHSLEIQCLLLCRFNQAYLHAERNCFLLAWWEVVVPPPFDWDLPLPWPFMTQHLPLSLTVLPSGTSSDSCQYSHSGAHVMLCYCTDASTWSRVLCSVSAITHHLIAGTCWIWKMLPSQLDCSLKHVWGPPNLTIHLSIENAFSTFCHICRHWSSSSALHCHESVVGAQGLSVAV